MNLPWLPKPWATQIEPIQLWVSVRVGIWIVSFMQKTVNRGFFIGICLKFIVVAVVTRVNTKSQRIIKSFSNKTKQLLDVALVCSTPKKADINTPNDCLKITSLRVSFSGCSLPISRSDPHVKLPNSYWVFLFFRATFLLPGDCLPWIKVRDTTCESHSRISGRNRGHIQGCHHSTKATLRTQQLIFRRARITGHATQDEGLE